MCNLHNIFHHIGESSCRTSVHAAVILRAQLKVAHVPIRHQRAIFTWLLVLTAIYAGFAGILRILLRADRVLVAPIRVIYTLQDVPVNMFANIAGMNLLLHKVGFVQKARLKSTSTSSTNRSLTNERNS